MRIGLSTLTVIAVLSWGQAVNAQGKAGGEAKKGSGSDDAYQELLKKGEAAVIGSDWEACVKFFKLARELNPDDPIVYLAIGRCSLEKGDNIQALRNLQRGMQRYSSGGSRAPATLSVDRGLVGAAEWQRAEGVRRCERRFGGLHQTGAGGRSYTTSTGSTVPLELEPLRPGTDRRLDGGAERSLPAASAIASACREDGSEEGSEQ